MMIITLSAKNFSELLVLGRITICEVSKLESVSLRGQNTKSETAFKRSK